MADLGTKAHPVTRFDNLRSMCGIVDCAKIDEHEEIETLAVESVEGSIETISGRRGTSATSGKEERTLLLTMLAMAPLSSMADNACDKAGYAEVATMICMRLMRAKPTISRKMSWKEHIICAISKFTRYIKTMMMNSTIMM